MRRLYLIVNAYTERVHYFLFGQTMGEGMALFVRQLSISFMGLIAANGIFFAAMLYIGRALGPETFGRFSLTIAIGQLLVIPMMLGMDVAAMRGVAVEQLLLWQKRYITAGFIVVMMGALTVAAIVFGFKQYWESALTLPRGALAMAAVLAMSLAFRNYFDAVARGLGRFKVQALVRMAEALIALGAAVVLAWLGSQNRWRGFVGAIITAATSASLLYIAGGELGSFISFAQWRTATAWHMWRYIRFGMLGALGAVMLVSADKILVGRIFGAPQLGIYAAYHLLSVQVALQLSYVFINVFFPAVSRQRNKQAVLRKLDRLAVYFTGPALALSV
ncbi:MAG: oligosaccharide flippase family protein, partial [Candidatus Andersenbacteria bacterium]|nr:oligosaccharide flippase family protein [Candidatus Andersenbacteria bacterium]